MTLDWKHAWTAAWRTGLDAFLASFSLFSVVGLSTGDLHALLIALIVAVLAGVLSGFIAGASALVEGLKEGYQTTKGRAFVTGFVRTFLQTLIGTAGALQALEWTIALSTGGASILVTGLVNATIAGFISGLSLLRSVPDSYTPVDISSH